MLALIGFAHVTVRAEADHFLIRMPAFFKAIVDSGAKPEVYFALSIALFAAVVWLREQLVKPTVAWLILNGMILFLTLSMSDYDFRQIVGKPDNVPIVSMLFIVAFFTWLYFKRAVDNDQRIAAGRPLFEQEDNDKVLVWPDLVYTEMICMARSGRRCWSCGAGSAAAPLGRARLRRSARPTRRSCPGTSWGCRKCSSTMTPGWRG